MGLPDPRKMAAPEFILILCCAVDAADKALLAATFRTLERDLGASPSQLGLLVLLQTMAYSVALPVWGSASSHFSSRDLLSLGCVIWGVATLGMACSMSFHTHCALRFLNGIGLCCVMPVAQAMLCELVPQENRGAAFGRLEACSTLAGMFAAWFAVSQQANDWVIPGGFVIRGWQFVYAQVAICSLLLAPIIKHFMPEDGGSTSDAGTVRRPFDFTEALSTARRIMKISSFRLLVLQGVTGGVPWNAMGFLTLYWHHCGFTDSQTGHLIVMQGFGAVVGLVFGGQLGDAAARRFPEVGRILVALTSILGGLPLFIALLYIVPRDASFFWLAGVVAFFFSATACWCPVAANRPICAELVSSSSERAQVVALWVMFEGVVASISGAPLVGFLSEQFGYKLQVDVSSGSAINKGTADSLARALVGVSTVAWLLCAAAWVAMMWTFPQDRLRAQKLVDSAESSSLLKDSKC